MSFHKAVENLLTHEGEYINHSNDPGGKTKFGISAKSYPYLEIENLTKEQAIDIYYRDWWQKYRYDRIKDEDLAIKILDSSVNIGPESAHKLIQRSLRAVGIYLKVDGILGAKSLAAINEVNATALIAAIRVELTYHYKYLILKNPSLKVFELGWFRRAYS